MNNHGVHKPTNETSHEELRRALLEVVPLQMRYADLYDEAPCGYVTCDARQHITGVNQTFAHLVLRSPHAMIDQPVGTLVAPSESDRRTFRRHWKWLCSQATTAQCEVRLARNEAAHLIAHLDSRSYFDPRGRLFEVRITVTDMTAQRRTEAKAREQDAIYRKVVELTPNPLFCIARDGAFLDCNTATLTFLGVTRDELLGSNAREFFRLANPSRAGDVVDTLWLEGGMVELDYARGGKVRTLHAAVTQIARGDAPQLFAMGTEVTAHKHTESALRHDALHDRLTGLPNRQLFVEQVDRALKRMRRNEEERFGLLFIDIDHFKRINDSLGHLMGDQLLREVGARLTSAVREVDVLARFAGDEFTVLIRDAAENGDVAAAGQRVLRVMEDPVVLGGTEVQVKVSIGGTVSRSRHLSSSEIIREADDAMYSAKRRGRNGYVPFGAPVQRSARGERRTAEARLRQAIGNEELVLHYQPIVSTAAGDEVLGVEALVRWPQQNDPCLLPDEFLYLVDETGLYEEMTRWVVRQTCRQVACWSDLHLTHNNWCASVNVCAQLINSGNLAGMIEESLNETGIDPRRLAIEVSEAALLEGCKGVDENVLALHRMGLRVVVHDFGAGLSEMSELCGFPVDGVKIDPSFVRLLDRQEKDRRVMRGLISLAQGLGFHVTAVGVETLAQLEYLRAAKCEGVQGFLISRPLPADGLQAWLADR